MQKLTTNCHSKEQKQQLAGMADADKDVLAMPRSTKHTALDFLCDQHKSSAMNGTQCALMLYAATAAWSCAWALASHPHPPSLNPSHTHTRHTKCTALYWKLNRHHHKGYTCMSCLHGPKHYGPSPCRVAAPTTATPPSQVQRAAHEPAYTPEATLPADRHMDSQAPLPLPQSLREGVNCTTTNVNVANWHKPTPPAYTNKNPRHDSSDPVHAAALTAVSAKHT